MFSATDSFYVFPGGSNRSESLTIYVDGSSGGVNVRSDFNYALNRACRVTVIYI